EQAYKTFVNLRAACAATRSIIEVLGIEYALRRAELAGDADHAVVADHVAPLLRRKRTQHGVDPFGRTATGVMQGALLEDTYAAFMNQPVQQTLARDAGIDQLVILNGLDEGARLRPSIVFCDFVARRPFRGVAGVEVRLAAPLDGIGQEL